MFVTLPISKTFPSIFCRSIVKRVIRPLDSRIPYNQRNISVWLGQHNADHFYYKVRRFIYYMVLLLAAYQTFAVHSFSYPQYPKFPKRPLKIPNTYTITNIMIWNASKIPITNASSIINGPEQYTRVFLISKLIVSS